ncbi:unnamed protein product [Mycena citricolor]|uniref:Integrase catalytic domain-containing protein n=1 Tax=Mycena citricolor TaxID=2018698 RepID=A0AAD2HYK9_9AGAR|nr:unnamed protein product [Mycena citricolor]
MSANLPSIPLLNDDQKLASDGSNWATFKEVMVSMARGRGLDGYLFGTVLEPAGFVANNLGPSSLNATMPSPDEYTLRDGWVAALLFQNIKDPRAHDLKGTDQASMIWSTLVHKFNRSTELLVGLKMERLRTLTLKDPRYLMTHIDELVKRRAEVHDIGGTVPDPMMCTIILTSLPKEEFGTALIALQVHSVVAHLVQHLREWWDLVWKKRMEEEGNGATANALAVGVNATGCENCGVRGHDQRGCWARGGGKEGQAPGWWKPPRGKEPSPDLVNAHRNAKESRRFQSQQAPSPTAAFTNPMTTYVLAAKTADDGTLLRTGDPPQASDTPFRTGRRRETVTVLNGEVRWEEEPVAYAALSVHESNNLIPTFLDSGASEHCVVKRSWFVTYQEVEGVEGQTAVKAGGRFQISGRGDVEMCVRLENGEDRRIRFSAIHTPDFGMNLISIPMLDKRGFQGSWGQGVLNVIDQEGTVVISGRMAPERKGGRSLYSVQVVDDGRLGKVTIAIAGRDRRQPTSLENWHRRMGHADIRAIRSLRAANHVDGLDVTDSTVRGMCNDCILGKHDRTPFNDEVTHESEPLERVHLDLWGRARTPSWGHAVYLLLVSDGGTSMKFPLFLSDKRQETVLKAFSSWLTEAEVQTERKLKTLRVDLGSEFDNDMFTGFCRERGIVVERVPKASSAAHGHAERGNRTVIAGARTQLIESGLDHRFWAEATAAHCYVRSFIPSARHPRSVPWVRWFRKKNERGEFVRPNILHLRVWGSKCWVKDLDNLEGKLGAQGWEGRMVGYMGRRGYRIYDPKRMKVYEVRNVIFEEGEPHRTEGVEPSDEPGNVLQTEEDEVNKEVDEPGDEPVENPQETVTPTGEERLEGRERSEVNEHSGPPPLPRRSKRVPKPSRRGLESLVAQQAEEEARRAQEDWARDSIRPAANWVDRDKRKATTKWGRGIEGAGNLGTTDESRDGPDESERSMEAGGLAGGRKGAGRNVGF